jgi:hypothetical protein
MHRVGPDHLGNEPDEPQGDRRRPVTPNSAARAVSAPASCPSSRPPRRLPPSMLVPGRK